VSGEEVAGIFVVAFIVLWLLLGLLAALQSFGICESRRGRGPNPVALMALLLGVPVAVFVYAVFFHG
jgi:hypothetical protein